MILERGKRIQPKQHLGLGASVVFYCHGRGHYSMARSAVLISEPVEAWAADKRRERGGKKLRMSERKGAATASSTSANESLVTASGIVVGARGGWATVGSALRSSAFLERCESGLKTPAVNRKPRISVESDVGIGSP
jgi:hypothetical protein